MTKQTKMLLGVGALAVVGYLVYTKMGSGTKTNAIGKKSKVKGGVRSGFDKPATCGEGCTNGTCRFDMYDEGGKVTGYNVFACKDQTKVLYAVNY